MGDNKDMIFNGDAIEKLDYVVNELRRFLYTEPVDIAAKNHRTNVQIIDVINSIPNAIKKLEELSQELKDEER